MPEVNSYPARDALNDEDVEILRLYGELGRYSAVAEARGVKVQTVKNRLSWIYGILEVPGAAAAIYAVFVQGRRDGRA